MILLTSISQRRRDLLEQVGFRKEIDFVQFDTPVNVGYHSKEPKLTLDEVRRMSVEVARTKVRSAVAGTRVHQTLGLPPEEIVVVGADTVVYSDGRVLDRPLPLSPSDATPRQLRRAEDVARQMLSDLRGREFRVLTGLVVAQSDNPQNERSCCTVTEARMKQFSDNDIECYVRTGEPLDKAGGFCIQERGVVLFQGIKGSYSNVVGLPLFEFLVLLRDPFFARRVQFRIDQADSRESEPVDQGVPELLGYADERTSHRLYQSMSPRLLMASASPRRLELLRQIVADNTIEVLASDHEEAYREEDPLERVKRLALEKARTVLSRRAEFSPSIEIVIGADTEVVIDGEAVGHPEDGEHARHILGRLSGRRHQTITGLALIDTASGREVVECTSTQVKFKPLSEEELEQYVRSGEPMGKAGAYGIQGRGAIFIEEIDGSYSNVVGLPLERLSDILDREFGLPIWDIDEVSSWTVPRNG
jgi:septum formation protein